ncbi:hypothetical protein QEH52_11335 [Coraliomargarita sp. SDUM461003]|uniref:Carrier domain-containing protein n=1 Tax=Thalassobacterium maritimum TaxID=3041265 RepID=A0ABU1AXZ0_9BACT|nr:hypothetical protein [Coraliomargarita sp. SDUM461003]MDQ8208104.1 hypothetical protein [Coraliomargarita sp. SDUM461003]
MTIQREQVLQVIIETLHELGEDLELPELLAADENTRLFGARSALDSMNLVNFIAEVEERVSEEFGVDILLANQSAMSMTHSPFRKVSSCTDYALTLIKQEVV